MSSFSHHVLLYLRTFYIVWSLVRRRVTRRLTGLQTMHNVAQIAKHLKTVAVRLRLIFNLLMFSTVDPNHWRMRQMQSHYLRRPKIIMKNAICADNGNYENINLIRSRSRHNRSIYSIYGKCVETNAKCEDKYNKGIYMYKPRLVNWSSRSIFDTIKIQSVQTQVISKI